MGKSIHNLFKLLIICTFEFVKKKKKLKTQHNVNLSEAAKYYRKECCPLMGRACWQGVDMEGFLWGRVLPHMVEQWEPMVDWGKLDSQDMVKIHRKACRTSPHLKIEDTLIYMSIDKDCTALVMYSNQVILLSINS